MLTESELVITNLLFDKGMDSRTIIAVLHATDTEERQRAVIKYINSEGSISRDALMSEVKKIFCSGG